MRGRYTENGTAQRLEPQEGRYCNTLTSVQKDNMILEINDDTRRDDKAGNESGSNPVVLWGGG